MTSAKEKSKKWTQDSGRQFNDIASVLFAPLYPILAKAFVSKSGLTEGICLDLGSGPGHLGIALAKAYPFKVYGIDFSDKIISVAEDNIIKAQPLVGSVEPVLGNVDNLPFEDNFADLIISRGSIFFWDDLEAALLDIHRVLKPGGTTFIGGGFGTPELRDHITSEMRKNDPDWQCHGSRKEGQEKLAQAKKFLDSHSILFTFIEDGTGQWISIRKETI